MMPFARLAALCVVCLLATATTSQTGGRRVVSYLVSDSELSDLWGPDPPLDPTPYDWRIYDPETRRDFSFLRIPGRPSHIRWDRTFRSVEFNVGRDVYRAPWGPNSKAAIVAHLPVDSTVCDFWRDDRDASWNYASDRHIGDLDRHGSRFSISSAEVWKSTDRGAHWTLVKRDSCWEVSCGCVTEWIPRGNADAPVTLFALQDSMRIGHHHYRVLRAARDGEETGEESLVAVPIEGMPGSRLELMLGFGDSPHAKLPIVYVNPRQAVRRTLCPADTSFDLDLGQIGFQQEGSHLLVAGEYVGGNACVADLRTGRIRFRLPTQARWSVWTPWPR